MSVETNKPGDPGGSLSDSAKLDLLTAYVREQRAQEKSWTESLGKVTVYLAVAAFFFGIGTLSDLRNRFFPPPPPVSRTVKNAFVEALDAQCQPYWAWAPGTKTSTGYARIVADDREVLTERIKLNQIWRDAVLPSAMTRQDGETFLSIDLYYVAANDALIAAVTQAQRADAAGYAMAVAAYHQNEGIFAKAATDFGFTYCARLWAVDPPPNP